MSIVIIAGGGKFGQKAIQYSLKKDYKTVLIDKNPNCSCSSYATHKFEDLQSFYAKINGIESGEVFFLIHDISGIYDLVVKLNPEYIIPVVPIHLLANIIENFLLDKADINLITHDKLTKQFATNVNENLLLAHKPEKGVVYLSYAKFDEICPEDCIGPENYCPNFKRVKPITITRYIQDYYKVENNIRVIKNKLLKIIIINESYQLTSGLGGLKGSEIHLILAHLNQIVNLISSQNLNLIIATTCNCHGVINFYKNYEKLTF